MNKPLVLVDQFISSPHGNELFRKYKGISRGQTPYRRNPIVFSKLNFF